MKRLILGLIILGCSLVASAQCPSSVVCDAMELKLSYSSLPNSGSVDSVGVVVSADTNWLPVNSVPSDTLVIPRDTFDCTDFADGFVYKNGSVLVGTACNTRTALPVDFINIEALDLGEVVIIKWSTAWELNSDYFLVEKVVNGSEFEAISGHFTAAGNTNEISHYHFADNSKMVSNIYRIQQVDFDGTINYSKLVKSAKVLAVEPVDEVIDIQELTGQEIK